MRWQHSKQIYVAKSNNSKLPYIVQTVQQTVSSFWEIPEIKSILPFRLNVNLKGSTFSLTQGLVLGSGMPHQRQILLQTREERKMGMFPFKSPTHELLSNTAFSIFHIPSLSLSFNQTSCLSPVCSVGCACLSVHVHERDGEGRNAYDRKWWWLLLLCLNTWPGCFELRLCTFWMEAHASS